MATVKKILIIRFSSIGDIVLTTPVIRCLRKQYPDARIDYLTKDRFSALIEGNPYISNVLTIKKDVSEILTTLKGQRYDFIVDLHKNLRSAMVKTSLRRPSGTFSKLNIRKWLLVNLRVNLLPDIHIVDRYFRAVRKLGVTNDRQGLDYFIPDKDEVDIGDLPVRHRKGYIAFVIGGKHNTKMLPAGKVISICRLHGSPCILLGGEEDRDTGEMIKAGVGDAIFNACGIYNINQSASLIRQASMVISNDTGLMHVAAAFNKPVISVWGSTVTDFGMYPYMPQYPQRPVIMEVKGLSCRPCSKIGFSQCPKKHFKCMMEIEEEEIVKLLNSY